jgi:hypothetical protein
MEFPRTPSRRFALVAACWCAATCCYGYKTLRADEDTSQPPSTVRTPHFVVHSDLTDSEVQAVIKRMEATLDASERYWGQPLRGSIECYVVKNLDAWPDWKLPHPMARVLIGRVGGATVGRRVKAGNRQKAKAMVFASTGDGVAEHEVVHAYCGQTFGAIGPDWYREGMAQMITYRRCSGEGVKCPPRVLKNIKSGKRRQLGGILRAGAFSKDLSDSLKRKASDRDELLGLVPLEDWTESDVRSLSQMHQSYSWSWLACHMLDENPNYRARFRSMGIGYLINRQDSRGLFETLSNEMDFEFRFMVDRLDDGYRSDLCYWDWNKRFRPLDSHRDVRVCIKSARGYQASGLTLEAGRRYCYSSEGSWQVSEDAAPVGAEGDEQGWGALEGVIMNNYQLSQPFLLRNRGQFIAPSAGLLYLRCRDQWNQIADNTGDLVVVFTRSR